MALGEILDATSGPQGPEVARAAAREAEALGLGLLARRAAATAATGTARLTREAARFEAAKAEPPTATTR